MAGCVAPPASLSPPPADFAGTTAFPLMPEVLDVGPPAVAASHRPAAAAARHVVRRGETLFSIAANRLGSGGRWREIAAANPGLDPASLAVGATLTLP